MTTSLITIWENNDGCAEQYRCASALYLMSVMSKCYSIIIDRGIISPGHGKEVVDGLNDVDNHYIYQLISTVQLPGSIRFDSQIKMHTGTETYYVNLAKEFKDHLMVLLIKEIQKQFLERKLIDIQYHVQDNADVKLKYVKMYCNTNQFPVLSFSGPYSKSRGARGLSKNYHLRFYQKLGM